MIAHHFSKGSFLFLICFISCLFSCSTSGVQKSKIFLLFSKEAQVVVEDRERQESVMVLKNIRTTISAFEKNHSWKIEALSLKEFLAIWDEQVAKKEKAPPTTVLVFHPMNSDELEQIYIEVLHMEWDSHAGVLNIAIRGEVPNQELHDVAFFIDLPMSGD